MQWALRKVSALFVLGYLYCEKSLAAAAPAESSVNQLTQSGEYAKIRKTKFGVDQMEHRVAMISIIAQETEGVEQLNALLHEYAPYIIGRMGIPYRQRGAMAIGWPLIMSLTCISVPPGFNVCAKPV